MRAFSLLALALLTASLTAAQEPSAGWAALGAGVEGGASAVALGADGHLYLGGYFTQAGGQQSNIVAAWDGTSWTSLGSTEPSGQVWAFAFAPDGRLYAGGDYFSMSGAIRHSLAVWDGTAWSNVGGGVTYAEGAQTYAAVVYAMVIGADGRLYVGGDFNRGRNEAVPMSAVGAWDGSAWSAVGGAGLGRGDVFRPTVRALVFGPDGRLYAGGEFTTADGQPVANVAAWDGTAWDDLGGGLPNDGGIYALTFGPDGRLYAGGGIGVVAGVETDIAAWDGTAWAPVGPELQTPEIGGARALAFSADGKFYVGGFFTLPDGSRNVARLDNYAGLGAAVWVGLDGGVTHPSGEGIVSALAVGPEGEVYVGGLFDRVWQAPGGASVAANNVAVWLGDRVVGGEAPVANGALALSVSPNPSRGVAQVAVTLAAPSAVRVVVADVLGREVAVVHDGPLAAGTHALPVDVSRWPAGVYAVRVVAGSTVTSQRVSVVR